MERINQFDLYTLGQQLKALTRFDNAGPVSANEAFQVIIAARAALNRLLAGNPTPLGVSRTTAQQLKEQLDTIWTNHFMVEDEDGTKKFKFPEENAAPIAAWSWRWMCTALERFETVFQEDMREAAAYVVPRRGIYSTASLVDRADETFPAEVSGFIPDKAKRDFRAAGRCLAFNLLTASGYHVGRAVEGMLESYYQFFCNKPVTETLNGWKDYIEALDKVRKAGTFPDNQLSEKTLKELDQMREDYRNPLAHPRVELNESEARMVFSNGESLIIGMAGELGSAVTANAAKSATAALTLLTGAN